MGKAGAYPSGDPYSTALYYKPIDHRGKHKRDSLMHQLKHKIIH